MKIFSSKTHLNISRCFPIIFCITNAALILRFKSIQAAIGVYVTNSVDQESKKKKKKSATCLLCFAVEKAKIAKSFCLEK